MGSPVRFLPWREDNPAPGAPAGIGPETQAEWEAPFLLTGSETPQIQGWGGYVWASSLVTSQQLC